MGAWTGRGVAPRDSNVGLVGLLSGAWRHKRAHVERTKGMQRWAGKRRARHEKENASCDSFRSSDLRVMSPARFRCATQLAVFAVEDGQWESGLCAEIV